MPIIIIDMGKDEALINSFFASAKSHIFLSVNISPEQIDIIDKSSNTLHNSETTD